MVFQAEIRKVLAHLGRRPSSGAFSGQRKEEVIDEVVLAATTLASQRTGAIIVIERDMGLRSYVETGIALDAVLTYDLLISIFNPGTPLHDGAVIIQGNRGRGRLLPAPDRQPRAVADPGQPAPGRHRPHRGHRRPRGGGLRGDGHHLARARRAASAASWTARP